MLEVASYLERIAYSGSTPSIDTLRAIHHAHLQTVPFENLDVALGRKIVLDEGALLPKLIDPSSRRIRLTNCRAHSRR